MTKICKVCGEKEVKDHVCTDGAIYQYFSKKQNPAAFNDLVDEIVERIREQLKNP